MKIHLPNKRSAFTLIELLIVIVILAILTGLVLTIIDPVRQRERAKDAVIKANMAKVVAAINAYYSAFGTYPTCSTLLEGADPEAKNVTISAACSTVGTTTQGTFRLNGVELPATCDASGYGPTPPGSTPCVFRYEYRPAAAASGTACLGAQMFRGDETFNPARKYLLWRSDGTNAGNIVSVVWADDNANSECDIP